MLRSIAQFGAWALSRAQKAEIDILDDDAVSVISSGTDNETDEHVENKEQDHNSSSKVRSTNGIGKTGHPLPKSRNHMIEQLIDRHGNVLPLYETDAALSMAAENIDVIKPEPVRKWLAAKKDWDTKFAKERIKIKRRRAKAKATGYHTFGDDDVPPPSALAGRCNLHMPAERKKRSLGLSLWSFWGSSHDKETVSVSNIMFGN